MDDRPAVWITAATDTHFQPESALFKNSITDKIELFTMHVSRVIKD